MAHHLHRHVGPVSVGEFAHQLGPVLNVGHLGDVDDVVGAEGERQFQALGHAVEGDHACRPARLGDRDRIEAERARALHQHGLAELLVHSFEAVHHLRQRAIGARGDVVGNAVGNGVDDRPGRQQVVVGVSADEVGRLVGTSEHRHLQVQTPVTPARQAIPAPVAAEEVREDHPGAGPQRLAARIRADTGAERFDRADHFVTQNGRQLTAQPAGGEGAMPGVHVRAADVGPGDLDQDLAGANVVQGDCFDFEGLTRPVESSDASCVHERRIPFKQSISRAQLSAC